MNYFLHQGIAIKEIKMNILVTKKWFKCIRPKLNVDGISVLKLRIDMFSLE